MDRMDFYKKCYPTFIGTYVFSYIGRLADHGYLNEMEDVSWTSAIRRIPMITMVEIGNEFSITFLQNFETSKYADAIAEEMERLGITVTLKKKLSSRGHAPVEYKRYYGLPEPQFCEDDPVETDSFENRIKCKALKSKVRSSREASSYIEKGMTLGVSGFTLSGYPKKVAKALAARAKMGEKLDLTVTASENVIKDILPVFDDFERALQNMEKNGNEADLQGVTLIFNKLKDTLKKKGLEEIEAMDAEFNTDEHEALTMIPAPEEDKKGKVLDVIQKGYKLNGKVIRFARVVVGN